MMTSKDAYQAVEDMLLVCQKIASVDAENAEGAMGMAYTVDPALNHWVSGDHDIRPTLIEIVTGKKPLTGGTLYNLMSIAHTLHPAIGALAPLRLPDMRELPKPELEWCSDGTYSR